MVEARTSPRADLATRLGIFEFEVLSAVSHLGATAYGVSIYETLCQELRRDVSLGACYSALSRLESKGYVKSREGEPTPERGGRRKRFFTITAAGYHVLRDSIETLQGAIKLVPAEVKA